MSRNGIRGLAAAAPFQMYATAFGVTVEVRASSKKLLNLCRRHLPHAATLTPDGTSASRRYALTGPCADGSYRLYANSRKIADFRSVARLMEIFGRDAIIHVADFAGEFVFVHAGVVGWKGRVLLFPGRSFAGKTTLVASLVRSGAVYYSDEFALLDERGMVHPYARDLQMRKPGGIRQRSLPIEALNGRAGDEAMPVGGIYFLQFCKGSVWSPRPMGLGEAVLQTLPHTIPVRRAPARVLRTLSAAYERAAAWQGERGDADATAALILAEAGV